MRADRLKTVVRRIDPDAERRRWVLQIAAVVAVGAGGFVAGNRFAAPDLVPLEDPQVLLRDQILRLETRAEVDRTAQASLRGDLSEARAQIDELERELAFYRGVMAPEEQGSPLQLREPTLVPADAAGEWRYQVVVQQGARTDTAQRGRLRISVSGVLAGAEVTYSLADLDPALTDDALALNFRYFQRFEGLLRLPNDFVPGAMVLNVELTKPSSLVLERSFHWPSEATWGAASTLSAENPTTMPAGEE